ncbi:hypothetical protein K493DRAFT_339330 [Basidiobolus meristosporus CBS 931.73]|uniref:histidine kinase n=1 Tax=Basidiobolus meristosporus CBS 931.73 TaxID=1314790 RepID=A0A1Y1Y0E9_9FUNG|nr:hypothetical protein K493DRAFT_339330 [Basidiobolus meristosporus CBS 931.73]|eukprot:ORX91481.1 hypothetical protein K493DRAFT_339330 [Basidiobolus meristosporus CBS 931.73]
MTYLKFNTNEVESYVPELKPPGITISELVKRKDWSQTSLGPRESWPEYLKWTLNLVLHSSFPMAIYYGEDDILLYNQGWSTILGTKHPEAFGEPGHKVWSEIWHIMKPFIDQARDTGEGVFIENHLFLLQRAGYEEETWFRFSISPLFDPDGKIVGVLNTTLEQTQEYIGQRRLKTLTEVGKLTRGAQSHQEACYSVISALKENNADAPWSMIYYPYQSNGTTTLELVASSFGEVDGDSRVNPCVPAYLETIHHDDVCPDFWPVSKVATQGEAELIRLPDGTRAVFLPLFISRASEKRLSAVMVCGLHHLRLLDCAYKDFFSHLAAYVTAAIRTGITCEEEKKQIEDLAELNHSKTAFFQNVSHELRTPLTLILSPLEQSLLDPTIPAKVRKNMLMVQRNARRLLKLVNTLLEFSKIEAGKNTAAFQITDISKFTRELLASFESTAVTLGIEFVIDIQELHTEFPVYIDQDMWEKILLNLVSNAFKFTKNGTVSVSLRPSNMELPDRQTVEAVHLSVKDTGIGISPEDMKHLFNRFYCVRSVEARSYEGTGIGLALVQELVHFHSGIINVESKELVGTTFNVIIPTGKAHIPPEFIMSNITKLPESRIKRTAELFIDEMQQWCCVPAEAQLQADHGRKPLTSPSGSSKSLAVTPDSSYQKPCILLADDNTDMRNYIYTLLEDEFEVLLATNGLEALEIINFRIPDLVLSGCVDVMMPHLDGLGLLKAFRENPKTATIPIIFLSARAGPEASAEGVEAGADDYLVKPFSAQELLARVRTNIKLSRLRHELLVQQKMQTECKQMVLNISGKIRARFGLEWILNETADEVRKALDADGLLICHNLANQSEFIVKAEALHKDSIFQSFLNHSFHYNPEMLTDIFRHFNEVGSGGIDVASLFPQSFSQGCDFTGIPIVLEDEIWGWILARQRPELEWNEFQCTLLEQIATQVGLAISHDKLVSEKINQEIQIEAVNAANRAKSIILANTSHVVYTRLIFTEIRTPLNAIIGLVSAFEDTQLTLEQREMLKIMLTASDVLLRVVNDILDMAKLEAGKIKLKPMDFSLPDLLKSTMDVFSKYQQEKDIKLSCICEPNVPKAVIGDSARVQQVLMNLLSNSFKFTDQGQISIHVEVVEPQTDTDVTDTSKITLRFRVSDTGIGIAKEAINKHLFRSFHQIDGSMTRKYEGVGLGLAICKELVEIGNGQIGVESTLGEGSTFWFTWHFCNSDPNCVIESKYLDMIHTQKCLTICDGDAEDSSITMLIQDLVRSHLQAKTFSQGLEYLKQTQSTSDPIQCVFLTATESESANSLSDRVAKLKAFDSKLHILLIFPLSSLHLAQAVVSQFDDTVVGISMPVTKFKLTFALLNFYQEKLEKTIKIKESEKPQTPGDSPTSLTSPDPNTLAFFPPTTNKDARKAQKSAKRLSKSGRKEASASEGTDHLNDKYMILVVEDNPVNMEVVHRQLKRLGYRSTGAKNGAEAVDILKQAPMDRFSLVLMDCAMPIKDGFEATRDVRQLPDTAIRDIPIVALSASCIESTQKECISSGMNDFLAKPVKLGELNQMLQKWLTKH